MAWETRGTNGRRYFYEARREAGKVVKIYRGSGAVGSLTPLGGDGSPGSLNAWWSEYQALSGAADMADRQAMRELEARERREDEARYRKVSGMVLGFYKQVQAATAETLEASGYHRPKRDKWRKQRKKRMMQSETALSAVGALSYPPVPMKQDGTACAEWEFETGRGYSLRLWSESSEQGEAMQRAQKGDTTGLPAVREFLDHASEAGRRLPYAMESARAVEAGIINLLHCPKGQDGKRTGDLRQAECLRRELWQLKASLAGPNPSPLEILLIERIGVCWLHLQQVETLLTGISRLANVANAGRIEEAYTKRLDGAQRRYLSAIKALAQVRRLNLPDVTAVQVNINPSPEAGTSRH